MKKILCFIYSLCFFAACAVPGIMLFKPDKNGSSEKRTLAELPQLFDENGEINRKWNSDFESFVSDNFGFRTSLVRADGLLKAKLFGTSSEEKVIVGKEGWLYYSPTADDFIGNRTVSDLGISNIVRNLSLMQEYAELHGSRFITAVVPNKNSIYPEFMPVNYIRSGENNNLDALGECLSVSGINYCDLYEVITNEKSRSDTLLYHKTDTHWNNSGALAGYRGIMAALDIPFENFDKSDYITEKTWDGDLSTMLFPDSVEKDYQNEYDIAFNYTYLGHYRGTDDITINTMNPVGENDLLMFRDSFGAAVIPYFSENFASARYSRARPYPLYNLEKTAFDVTVLEIVERNIAWLQREAPMHSALTADALPTAENSCGGTMYTEKNESFIHIYGTDDLSDRLTSAPEKYITLTDTNNNTIHYKAYNCYESELLGDTEILDCGYSLYISTSELTENETYTVDLTVNSELGCFGCALGEFKFE